ncbi:MAG: hypothetical protein ABW208_26610 [Pyrinomonadaceae bacterium]
MPKSQTRLMHTCPTEAPFDCTEGDLSEEGFLVVVDKRTHELLIPQERETDETLTVLVSPRVALTVERSDASAWREAEARAESPKPADHLKAALGRLSAAAEAQGFDVREVTLFFYEDEAEVRLKAELRITAELLDHTPALDQEAAGATRRDPSSSHERW